MLKTEAYDKLDEDFQDLIMEALENEGSVQNESTNGAKGIKNCD